MQKIQSHPNTQWCHVPSTENPADLGSCGASVTDVQLWWRGPEWLADLTSWPEDIVTQASRQSDAERKVQRKIFAAAIKISDDLDRVLEKFDLHNALEFAHGSHVSFATASNLWRRSKAPRRHRKSPHADSSGLNERNNK